MAEKLEEMGLSPEDFADYTGKSLETINAVINGKASITPDLATQFEIVTKIPARFWMSCQRSYDEFISKKKYKKEIEEVIA